MSAMFETIVKFIPARGLIGYRQEFMTDTKGEGILNTIFDPYQPYRGDIPRRKMGSLISFETGVSSGYGLNAERESWIAKRGISRKSRGGECR